MEILFIRHGKPDYTPCWERGFIGHGKDLACLTPEGIKQAEEVSRNPILDGSELIISSPYTRALQTAAIISKNTQLDIVVEIDLHEFLPDKTFQYKGKEESDMLHTDFINCLGIYPTGEARIWETIEEIKNRVIPVMKKYLDYNKIIVVAHGGVIRRFTGVSEVNLCTPYLVNFNENFNCFDFTY
ncbi:MAG: histidine phosphatase family protein [Defluviitaleaceae bacterium]|nr:histidine phosphatase family protein [Defluviitaleaceae bacterium]